MTYKLVLLRHGESEWNAKNLFTGWVDVPLSDKGRAEATHGGELLKESGVLPDLLFTSMLRRAIMTANLALDAADRHWIPVERNWRLNERHYGALLDEISDEDIAGVNIPTGIPLVYELDEETLKPVKKGGTYLDPEAEAKIAAVANQGK